MSVEEMRKQIAEKVKIMDEKALEKFLNILNSKENETVSIDATKHVDYLFNKHDGLLKRLA